MVRKPLSPAESRPWVERTVTMSSLPTGWLLAVTVPSGPIEIRSSATPSGIVMAGCTSAPVLVTS